MDTQVEHADVVDGTAPVDWLLSSREPAVRYLTRRDVLGERAPYDPEAILAGPGIGRAAVGAAPCRGGGNGPALAHPQGTHPRVDGD